MMNIKIQKPIQKEFILNTFSFGSVVYGTNTSNSDEDLLSIVSFDCGDTRLQYSNASSDIIYTCWDGFWKDIHSGASTINFEVLHEFTGNPLNYYTPKMSKAYLGFAKRDLDFPDRIQHVNRCIDFAQKIIKKELIVLSDVKNLVIRTDIEQLRNEIKELRESL